MGRAVTAGGDPLPPAGGSPVPAQAEAKLRLCAQQSELSHLPEAQSEAAEQALPERPVPEPVVAGQTPFEGVVPDFSQDKHKPEDRSQVLQKDEAQQREL